jgi:hypothetical protein
LVYGFNVPMQVHPDVPFQVQGSVMAGGSNRVVVQLIDLEPL